MIPKSALGDTARLYFDQLQVVIHVEETFRADIIGQKARHDHTEKVVVVKTDCGNEEGIW